MNETLEMKLQAWVDGELSAAEASAIERQIATDAEANGLVAELKSVTTAMAGNELVRTITDTREFYWSKIQREIERQARAEERAAQSPRVAAWRNWLSPFLGFASLACILLLAIKPISPPAFDEISSTGEGMEAVTFHDQSAGMTVVWLADAVQADEAQPAQTPPSKTPSDSSGEPDTELE